jgi:glyoxylase-like metal-dependent hydrolase (beta-lactamase superfamily II)
VEELPAGALRLTFPLPMRLDHVHCYLLPGRDGWTAVDTGLGLPDTIAAWERAIASLDAPVARIVVTHFHPDHVGAAADLAALTGASVHQGRLDYEQCELLWGSDRSEALRGWYRRHGVPDTLVAELLDGTALVDSVVHYVRDPLLLDDGDMVDGWRVIAAPGHADGQITLLKDGVLVAADHLLDPISPTIGLWPAGRPDPLGDYFASLEHTIELAPEVALPGHHDLIRDPARRAGQLVAHHRDRLDAAVAALGEGAVTAYDVSHSIFEGRLSISDRRFAIAEALSHLERLVVEGRADRGEADGVVSYTAAQ